MPLAVRAVPPPSHTEARDAIVRAMARLAEEGITSAIDAMTGHDLKAAAEAASYRGALESGQLKGRIILMPQIMHVAVADSEEPAMNPSEFDVMQLDAFFSLSRSLQHLISTPHGHDPAVLYSYAGSPWRGCVKRDDIAVNERSRD